MAPSGGGGVGCVITACTLDHAFLPWTVTECLEFAGTVVVAYGDRLVDGQPGDEGGHGALQAAKHAFRARPEVRFVQYAVDPVDELIDAPELRARGMYWPNRARWEGVAALPAGVRHVMFLDADEVPEGRRMREFLTARPPGPATALRFAAYWYFRLPVLRCRELDVDAVTLVPWERACERDAVMLCERGRAGLAGEDATRHVTGLDPAPLVHHYKWVRSAEGLLAKARLMHPRLERAWRLELQSPDADRPGRRDAVFGNIYQIVPSRFHGLTPA